jgi:hypothetical protein
VSATDPYVIECSIPSVAAYIELRTGSGLSMKTPDAVGMVMKL